MKYDSKDDGITHINIYSKGKTLLGKMLSNWSYYPIYLVLGRFNSIEGLIFYLSSNDEKLKELKENG